MASKSKKKHNAKNKSVERKSCSSKKCGDVPKARQCVSKCAPRSQHQCPMKLIVFLSSTNHWYLQTNSCLQHKWWWWRENGGGRGVTHWVPADTMFRRTKKIMKVQRKKAVTMTTGDEQEMTLSQNFSNREAERIIPICKYKFV
jgi:hypothetical protein